jgi:chorismate mutase
MELHQLTQMMMETSKRIDKATKEIFKMAREKAETEFEYRQALSKEIAKLKSENTPVTLIADMARGNVADLKLKRDLADAMFKSAIESLRALQSELSGLQTISKYQEL